MALIEELEKQKSETQDRLSELEKYFTERKSLKQELRVIEFLLTRTKEGKNNGKDTE